MDESPGMVLPLNVEGCDGKKLTVQATEDIFGPNLTPVGEQGLGEREFGLRCIGGIDTPAHAHLRLVDGLLVTCDVELVAHFAFPAWGFVLVAMHLPFCDLALDVIGDFRKRIYQGNRVKNSIVS